MSEPSKLVSIFLTTAAVVLGGLVAVYFLDLATISSNDALLRHHVVIRHLQALLSDVKDTETGQRGFLLTGEQAYLEPYKLGVAKTNFELDEIGEFAKTGELSEGEVTRLSQLVGQKLQELHETIALRATKGLSAALSVVQTNFGKDVMDQIRAQVGTMTSLEEAELARSHQTVDELIVYRKLAIFSSALLGLIVLGWAYRRINDEAAGRLEAALGMQRQKELLEVTLTSIGDAVIVTDIEGRITFMNKVAEELTGWTINESRD